MLTIKTKVTDKYYCWYCQRRVVGNATPPDSCWAISAKLVPTLPLQEWKLKWNSELPIINKGYCWFARDVTEAVLVVNNKSISQPLGTLFHVNSSRKNSIVLTPNMAAWSRGCKPRILQFMSEKEIDKHYMHY